MDWLSKFCEYLLICETWSSQQQSEQVFYYADEDSCSVHMAYNGRG